MAKTKWIVKLEEGFDKYSDEITKEKVFNYCNDNCLKNLSLLFQGIENHLDEDTKRNILNDCGRNCTPVSLITKAKRIYKQSENDLDFLVKFSSIYNKLKLKNGDVYIEYSQCFCGKAKKITDKLPPSYCYCSEGWVKELFEKTLNRPIKVTLEKSIVRGDDFCRFKVDLE